MSNSLSFIKNSHNSKIYIIISAVLFFIFLNCPIFVINQYYSFAVFSKYTPFIWKIIAILIPTVTIIARYNNKFCRYIFYINIVYFISILAIPIVSYSYISDRFHLSNIHISTTILCISFLSIVFLILAVAKEDKEIKNISIILGELIESSNKGNMQSQLQLAEIYNRGVGLCLPKNARESIEWYTKAAKQGSSIAQYNLGIMYKDGEGTSKNYQEAIKWFTQAANQGNLDAQNNLGAMYEYGLGVARDNIKAMEWYLKAAKQGSSIAQYNFERIKNN